MSQMGDFWHDVDKRSKSNNQNPVEIGEIISLQPLTIGFQGLELSVANGDKIYINDLLLDELFDLTPEKIAMDLPQQFSEMTPPPWTDLRVPPTAPITPITEYTVKIDGTQREFYTKIYEWLVSIHDRFILHVGDMVAVQRLGNNTYLILEKVQELE